ncbi:hypothetical protein [Paraflavitalea speifideaquila]|uniref:hypothetical protein n=1 Tax=Paraflavitalea speifideaquila TaxID=3076558 RepID=UPI0028E9C0EE|nr:hypothetical protein [Paraflavitalea speifideiaquila]
MTGLLSLQLKELYESISAHCPLRWLVFHKAGMLFSKIAALLLVCLLTSSLANGQLFSNKSQGKEIGVRFYKNIELLGFAFLWVQWPVMLTGKKQRCQMVLKTRLVCL